MNVVLSRITEKRRAINKIQYDMIYCMYLISRSYNSSIIVVYLLCVPYILLCNLILI